MTLFEDPLFPCLADRAPERVESDARLVAPVTA